MCNYYFTAFKQSYCNQKTIAFMWCVTELNPLSTHLKLKIEKERKLSHRNLFRKQKSTPVQYHQVQRFFLYVWDNNLLCFGCFPAGKHPDRCYLFIHCNIYNWLCNSNSKLATGLSCHVHFVKSRLCFWFSLFLIALFLCMRLNQSGSLGCWTANAIDS